MAKYSFLYGKDCRFGMFIHWGVYALTEYHEQTLLRTPIGRDAYEQLYHQFNPMKFCAEEWVLLAKQAGMRYICLTAKHHDGFCMWDTKETDYNVMNTPFGRDVVKEFSEACQKHGLRLALYYSNPDWHHPNAYNARSSHQIPPRDTDTPDMEAYIAFLKRQMTELLTQYGPISGLFWDIPPKMEDRSINELARRLQPGIRINDRGFDEGDFSTPEREVPHGAFTRLTEACQSVGQQSWGYRRNEDYYTARFLEASMDAVLSKGGNYLLNIGPMPDGSMPPQAKKLLESIGTWYTKVQEAYAGDNSVELFSDRTDFTVTRNGNSLYLHFPGYPTASGLFLPPLTVLPQEVTLLNTGESIPFSLDTMPTIYHRPDGQTPYLHLCNIPFDALSGEVPVIRLTFDSFADVERCFEASAISV